jgi:hypothetical protein
MSTALCADDPLVIPYCLDLTRNPDARKAWEARRASPTASIYTVAGAATGPLEKPKFSKRGMPLPKTMEPAAWKLLAEIESQRDAATAERIRKLVESKKGQK